MHKYSDARSVKGYCENYHFACESAGMDNAYGKDCASRDMEECNFIADATTRDEEEVE